MINERYLSRKKTTSQNISISPHLKDLIERYIKNEREKNPNDSRFRSVSAFYRGVMKSLMALLTKGRSLDELERAVDPEVQNFYDKMTFKAIIQIFENSIEMNRYSHKDQDMLIPMAARFKDFISGETKQYDDDALLNMWDRFKNFMFSNNITKDISLEIIDGKYIIEYSGYYSNLHQNYVKTLISVLSALGLSINGFFYYKNYVKLELKKQEWFGSSRVSNKKMKEQLRRNMKFFLNYYRIVLDESPHLWMRVSDTLSAVVGFRDVWSGISEIDTILKDIREFSADRDELKKCTLKLLEHFHWIMIDNIENLQFHFQITEEYNPTEMEIALDTLEKVGNVENKNGIYYFK